MSLTDLSVGFMPLVDAAPLFVAKEMGFAEEEGLNLTLHRAPSWSTLRDMLVFGQIQAAHMLSPVPVASHLGLMNGLPKLHALSVLSMNGNMIGLSPNMAEALLTQGYAFDFHDAHNAGLAVAQLPKPLRVGVPFHLSMHAELVTLWLSSVGLTQGTDFQIHAVPPPMMAQAIRNGDLDLFCVGEPWGSVTVETAGGTLILPTAAIWNAAPEKVLASRADWIDENGDTAQRLIRALWRAGEWLARPSKHTTVSELLAHQDNIGINSEIIDRAFAGRVMINASRDERHCKDLLRFHAGTANFPWQSQGAWIAARLAARASLNVAQAITQSEGVFRSDLYRAALSTIGAPLPLSSSKIEGGQAQVLETAAVSGSLEIGPNRFFDGQIFDPFAFI